MLAHDAAALVIVRKRLLVNVRAVARHANAVHNAFFLDFFPQRALLRVHAAQFVSQHLEIVRSKTAPPPPVLQEGAHSNGQQCSELQWTAVQCILFPEEGTMRKY